jgi:EpsI family protein
MRNLRVFVPAICFAVGCALINGGRPQRSIPLTTSLNTIPSQLAGYSGEDRPISPEEQAAAGMSNYVFRTFTQDSTRPFSVYVGYYQEQTTGKTIHSPKNCLPGAGWQSLESGRRDIAIDGRTVTVNRYVLANNTGHAVVYYWYQGRGRVASNEYSVKWDLLRDAALHGRTEEALVRVMVPVTQVGPRGALMERQAAADSLAQAVAKQLIPEVDRVLPSWDSRRAPPRA